MKKLLPALLFCFFSFSMQAQEAGWLTKIEGLEYEGFNDVQLDAEGNVYSLGSFSNEVSIYGKDTVFTTKSDVSSGYSDGLVSKHARNGELLWSVKFEGKSTVAGWTAHYGKDDCLYIGGNFKEDARFYSSNGESIYIEPEIAYQANKHFYRSFVAKYNANGELLWVRTGISTDHMGTFQIVTDDFGNAYAWTYCHNASVVFGDIMVYPGTTNYYGGKYEMALIKYLPNGTEEWVHFMTGTAPRQILMTNNNTVQVVTQLTSNRVHLFSTEGFHQELSHDYSKDEYRLIEIDSLGKAIAVTEICTTVTYANLKRYVPTEFGYYALFESKQNYNRLGSEYTIRGEKIKRELVENDLILVAFNHQHEDVWRYTFSSRRSDWIGDIEPLNNTIKLAFLSSENLVISKDEKDKVKFPTEMNKKFVVVTINNDGKLIDVDSLGTFIRSDSDERCKMASNAKGDFAYAYRLNKPGYAFGQKVNEKNPDNDRIYYKSDGVLIFQPSQAVLLANLTLHKHLSISGPQLANAFRSIQPIYSKQLEPMAQVIDSILENNPEPIQNQSVQLFPNPASANSTIQIKLNDFSIDAQVRIEFFTQNGQLLQQQNVVIASYSDQIQFEIPNVKPGRYVIRIRSGKILETKSIIVF